MRLIDADALKDEMRAGCVPIDLGGITGITGDDDSIEDYIDAAPIIDAIPVEWIKQVEAKGFDYMHCAEVILGLWEKEQEVR